MSTTDKDAKASPPSLTAVPVCCGRASRTLNDFFTAMVLCHWGAAYSKTQVSPFQTASLLSRMYFTWASPLIARAAAGSPPLTEDELWEMRPQESATLAHDELRAAWDAECATSSLRTRDPSFVRAVWRMMRFTMLKVWMFKMGWLLFAMLSNSLLLRSVINYLSSTDPGYMGAVLVIAYFLCEVLRSACVNQHWLIAVLGGVRLRAAVRAMVYDKSLKLAAGSVTVGKGVNILTADCARLLEAVNFGEFLISAPITIVVTLGVMWSQVGIASLAGFAVMLIFAPVQAWLGNRIGNLRRVGSKLTDERAKTMNEVLTGIKLIKFNAWEAAFASHVSRIRADELVNLRSAALLRAVNTVVAFSVPVLVTLTTFATYVLSTNEPLSPASAFVTVSLFNVARFVLNILPNSVRNVSEAIVACQRIQEFLELPEIQATDLPINLRGTSDADVHAALAARGVSLPSDLPPANVSMCMMRASFSWRRPAAAVHGSSAAAAAVATPAVPAAAASRPTVDNAAAMPNRSDAGGCVTNMSFTVSAGECVGIMGSVGSGKSSLLMAFLGQMHRSEGAALLRGSIAYVSQSPWIFTGSVRENITFGRDFDAERYAATIHSCALQADLQQLPAGDATEIGERGINISGGQKARVALARAVYADADIYLLDDPLSAVDVHVGVHLWRECIQSMLAAKGKTVLIATHQLQYLHGCSRVIEMDAGRVASMAAPGTFPQLTQPDDDAAAVIADAQPAAVATDMVVAAATDVTKEAAATGKPSSRLIAAEERASGSVALSAVLQYFDAAGSRWLLVLVVSILVIAKGARIISDWYLSLWTSRAPSNSSAQYQRELLGWYAVTVCGVAVFTGIQALAFLTVTLRAARVFHDRVFASVMRATSSWFDTQPTGRILARFTGDVDVVDSSIPMNLEMASENVMYLTMSIVLIAVIFPWFLIPLLPIVAVFAFIAAYFRKASRDLKRLDNMSRSPLVSHMQATLQGLASIRAFAADGRYRALNERFNDATSRTYWAFYGSNRWVAIRLDWVTTFIVAVTVSMCVGSRGLISPGLAALTIVQALQMAGLLQYTVRLSTDTEASFTSVERLTYYSTSVPQEPVTVGAEYTPSEVQTALATVNASMAVDVQVRAPAPVNAANSVAHAAHMNRKVASCGVTAWYPDAWNQVLASAQWPVHGALTLEGVSVRYRAGLPLVLRDITLRIHPHHKVGVVGRTGSGKSTLALTCFRMLECDSGRITLDGLDISRVNVYQLRSRCAVIPQDPTLYTGTVRSNLDVFNEYSDDELWAVLTAAGMQDFVKCHPKGLLRPVSEAGGNMSVGERQLLCLARALLRKARLIFMDEATANIDGENDANIQRAMRVGMRDATVIVIAHRLHTIMDCDRVLVMDAGSVIEYDAPAALLGLAAPREAGMITGAFKQMLAQTGPRTSSDLERMVVDAEAARGIGVAAALDAAATMETSATHAADGGAHDHASSAKQGVAATPQDVTVAVD